MAVQKLKGFTKKILNNMSKYGVKMKYALELENFTCAWYSNIFYMLYMI